MQGVFREPDAEFVRAIAQLNATNPFLPERIAWERRALGADFDPLGAEWNTLPPATEQHPNLVRLTDRAYRVIEHARAAWPKSGRVPAEQAELYAELVGFWLYQHYALRFDGLIRAAPQGPGGGAGLDFFAAFRRDAERCLDLPGLQILREQSVPHLFACGFQIRRAFHHIFWFLVGGSAPMARLRAAIWQSIFTHDLNRYRRVLYARMGDFATLITGPSGTGKELVARAIALSRYLPFDARRGGFVDRFSDAFYPLNLSALSPTLVESELFGHRRGAFTGALSDRSGWMETCPSTGAVFLDEIGDVDASIQVKLLRVLQSRTFQRLGDIEPRRFEGKIIAATHQDLPALIRAGRFREDFYYRLCSDLVRTPSLREQLDDSPADLGGMLGFVATRLLGAEEGQRFARSAERWIERNLGRGYAWPGNFRELEQCVRNLLVRAEYRPAGLADGTQVPEGVGGWLELARARRLTAEQVLTHYTQWVHAGAGSLEATAAQLGVDRRTVRARLPMRPRVPRRPRDAGTS